MKQKNSNAHDHDPLGLADLPLLEPEHDGWNAIKSALEADAGATTAGASAPTSRYWLAAAASIALVCLLVLVNQGDTEHSTSPATTIAAQDVPSSLSAIEPIQPEMLDELIQLSQKLDRRLRLLRDNTEGLPGESALYVAELEDLIGRLDNEISTDPGSLDLWGQRVNLMLDLETIFQHQWEIEYGRMASL